MPAGGPGGPGGRSPEPGQQLPNPIVQPQPAGEMFLGVSTNNERFASRVRARLSRREFEDYLERFAPIEADLAEFAMGGAGEAEAVAQADSAVSDAYATGAESRDRYLGGFGVGLTGAQRKSANRQNALESTAARVGARNTARRRAEDLQRRIMIGGVGSSGVNRGV